MSENNMNIAAYAPRAGILGTALFKKTAKNLPYIVKSLKLIKAPRQR